MQVKRNQNFELLKQQLEYAALNSAFYRERFKAEGIEISGIQSYEEFRNMPLTSKEDLQKFNTEFISIPKEEIIDFVTTSGTLGNPVSFALNEADLNRLAENERRSFEQVGVKPEDVVQITTTLDRRFMAGMAYFLGLRKLGAGIVRTGSGLPGLQWDSIQRFQPKFLVAVPSFLLKLIEYARANQVDLNSCSVRAAICIGESIRDEKGKLTALGERIKDEWDIELFSTYASTEMSTAFTECEFHLGNHIFEDLIYAEVLDEDGKEVQPGEIGELVVTPLQTQTMPLIRFATGDMVKYLGAACSCGNPGGKISSPVGRKQQKLKYRGTSLYPQQIINCLHAYKDLSGFVIEARTNSLGTDDLCILIPDIFKDTENLKNHLQSGLNVSPELRSIPAEELEALRFAKEQRKPVLFRDLR
jgi:phenylacetate-CoA ligase